ncbi:MAG: LysR family transcriptional regulator, partial [Rhizobiaceae bacterium]|nr:LysR family transcriptional regulator [Rhizobiaceae bacterium]
MVAPPLKKTISKLDLLSLRLFLTVCEEKSIGRAAERESITPSAVTKRIQDLEYLFDVKLLYRNAKGTIPTPVGEALADHARQIFQLVEGIRTDLSEFAQGAKGHVRISAVPSALAGFLAVELKDFAAMYPRIDLDVREQLSSEVVHAVATGTADIGVYATPPEVPADVASYAYRHDELVVVLPAAHPLATRKTLAFAEILSTDLVGVVESSSVMNQLRRAAADLNQHLRIRYHVQSNEVAREMVAAGFGVTVLPQGLATYAHSGPIA